ncbi:hypothetical protein C8R48DRAFT_679753 [Suillus tomentosus]|nr:hypothetical protein C8R48DRAFT_679753 [Suillus tomentosus]
MAPQDECCCGIDRARKIVAERREAEKERQREAKKMRKREMEKKRERERVEDSGRRGDQIEADNGGDTLFTSQISTLKKLSPSFAAFLRTLSLLPDRVDAAACALEVVLKLRLKSSTSIQNAEFSSQKFAFRKSRKRARYDVHSGVEQAQFSRSNKRGGIVRREPVELSEKRETGSRSRTPFNVSHGFTPP